MTEDNNVDDDMLLLNKVPEKYNKVQYVYVDGAVFANGKPNGQCGIGVYWSKDSPLNVSTVLQDDLKKTNSRAELQAVVKALEVILTTDYNNIIIVSDSKYAIQCACRPEWISRWNSNGWKKVDGQPVANQSDIKQMHKLIEQVNERNISLKFEHVNSHVKFDRNFKNDGNDQADRLANLAIQKFRKKTTKKKSTTT